MRSVATPLGRVIAVLSLVGGVTPSIGVAQDGWDDLEPVRDFVPPSVSVEALVFGVSDSNLFQEVGGLPSYGFRGGTRVRVQTAPTRPGLRLQWDWQVRQYEATERLDRKTHRFSAILQRRVGFLEGRLNSSLDLNGTTEDREVATVARVRPGLRVRAGPVRLGIEGRYWEKHQATLPDSDEIIRGGEADLGLSTRAGRVTVAVLYEEAQADRASRRFERLGYTGEYRIRIGEATTLEWESSYRDRLFPDRFVDIEGIEEEVRDGRWTHGGLIRYRRLSGVEFRLEVERQTRRSNDEDREYTADRIIFGMAIPLIDYVPRQ